MAMEVSSRRYLVVIGTSGEVSLAVERVVAVSGDLKLHQYGRFENGAFSFRNLSMKYVFLSVFFVSHVIFMGCKSHVQEPRQM